MLEGQIKDKDGEIERLRRVREMMREEKMQIEEKRLRRESELQEQNQRLHGLMAEEYEHSFKDNTIEQVDDVEERLAWKDDDTSYDDCETPSQQDHPLKKRADDNSYQGNEEEY